MVGSRACTSSLFGTLCLFNLQFYFCLFCFSCFGGQVRNDFGRNDLLKVGSGGGGWPSLGLQLGERVFLPAVCG